MPQMQPDHDEDMPLALDELRATLQAIGDPPCKGCPHFRHCATEPAACGDYITWSDGGPVVTKDRDPSRDLFDFVFGVAPFDDSMPAAAYGFVHAALSTEAKHNVDVRELTRTEAGITQYARWLREHGTPIAGGAMRVLLSRWPGEVPTVAKLDNVIKRKS